MKSSSNLLLALALVLSPASYANTSQAAREVQGSNMTANTAMTPADLGHRFLAMIKNVDSFDDLSANSVQRLLGVPLTTNGDKSSGFYVLESPNAHWEYSLTYNFDKKFRRYSNVKLEMIESETASEATPPPCDLILKEYDASLKESGFKPEPTSYNEFAWALAFYYSRNGIYVQVVPQNKALKSAESADKSCIEEISIHDAKG